MIPQTSKENSRDDLPVNALAKLLKPSMTTSTPVAPSKPSTGTPSDTSSDIVSRLPAELRHIVYSHLNIPVGGHIWIDCPSDSTCTDTSHIMFHANAKWPMRAHALFGVFQVRRKITNLLYYGDFRRIFAELSTGDIMDYGSRISMGRHLLGVNKAIRTEVMNMVFGCKEVELRCPMHDEAGRILKLHRISPIGTTNHIHLLPSALAHMTSVTIWNCECGMESDCQSLQFIAVNFTNLRHLTYHTQLSFLCLVPAEEVNALAKIFRVVTGTAKKLEILRFAWNEEDSTAVQCWNLKQQEMTRDKPDWDTIALEIQQLVDGLKDKVEANVGLEGPELKHE
ncbi:hypothetical protein ACET3X_009665 [Alternaria dauci]|uniref:Uncharacterized protein n=1 Tax=Alternaria dauci TaxID=48095 RepID=A0ABR3U8G0_9PLEO